MSAADFHRFTVPEYHKLIKFGILTEDDNLELLEGYLVNKAPRSPPHDRVLQRLNRRFIHLLPQGWDIRVQCAITHSDSEPEPDLAIVRGDDSTYEYRHPGPADLGLVIEVSDSTLAGDRIDKARIYARAGIPCYWIINLIDRQVEVHTQPSAVTNPAAYAQKTMHPSGDKVPLILDGIHVVDFTVDDLLP